MQESLQGSLESAAGPSGKVNPVYGGFEIEVIEPAQFPWQRAFELLIAFQMSVWVEKRGNRLVILSKPPPV